MSTYSVATPATTVESRFLTGVLRMDALASGALGLLLLLAGVVLEGPIGLSALLGVPVGLSLGAGLFLAGWTAALVMIARHPAVRRTALREVIAVNAAWVVASLALIFAGDLTTLGIVVVAVQAAAVAVLADLQFASLRRG
ncbi:hypothetical protein [Kribbella deserti]|uniref:Integral membrane protein n=1 Tax=Kribbella deserti TaxID=1926257 RepID=A0ABV6QL09_9ACTN